jgi:hypothetical protein
LRGADKGERDGDERDLVLLDEPGLDALQTEDALDVMRRAPGDDNDEEKARAA